MAVLVDFPPEPFYFPDVTHLDFALRYRSKAGRRGTVTTGLELEENGLWKDARGTYRKLKLATYNNSVLVQGLLKEHWWKAFQDVQCGNRSNPAIPERDVHPPAKGAETGPVEPGEGIELPPVSAPASPVSRGSAQSTNLQSLCQAVPSSDQEEAAEEGMELTVPTSPPRTLVPRQASSDAKLTQVVTDMVFQVKKTVATTPSISTSHQTSQSSAYAPRDPPTTRIPMVVSTEAGTSKPWTSSSSHSRASL